MLKCNDSVIVRFAFYTPSYPIRALTERVHDLEQNRRGFLTFSAQLPNVRIDRSVALSLRNLTKKLNLP